MQGTSNYPKSISKSYDQINSHEFASTHGSTLLRGSFFSGDLCSKYDQWNPPLLRISKWGTISTLLISCRRSRSRLFWTRKELFLYTTRNKGRPDTKHLLFHHRSRLWQFLEARNPEYHKKSVVDWINSNVLDRGVNCPPEIANFQHVETIQNVLRLYIPVDHIVAMQITDTAWNLSEVVTSQILGEVCFLANLSKETSICC